MKILSKYSYTKYKTLSKFLSNDKNYIKFLNNENYIKILLKKKKRNEINLYIHLQNPIYLPIKTKGFSIS